MDLSDSVGRVLLGSWAKARLVNSNQRERSFGSSMGAKACQGETLGRRGGTVDHNGYWESPFRT